MGHRGYSTERKDLMRKYIIFHLYSQFVFPFFPLNKLKMVHGPYHVSCKSIPSSVINKNRWVLGDGVDSWGRGLDRCTHRYTGLDLVSLRKGP